MLPRTHHENLGAPSLAKWPSVLPLPNVRLPCGEPHRCGFSLVKGLPRVCIQAVGVLSPFRNQPESMACHLPHSTLGFLLGIPSPGSCASSFFLKVISAVFVV